MAKSKLAASKAAPKEAAITFDFEGSEHRFSLASVSLEDLDDITPDNVRLLLSTAPGRHAYWAARKADIVNALRRAQDAFDFWLAEKSAEQLKTKGEQKYVSEKSKTYQIMETYPKAYAGHLAEIRDLEVARDKAEAIAGSYEILSRTLTTAAALMRREIEMLGQA